ITCPKRSVTDNMVVQPASCVTSPSQCGAVCNVTCVDGHLVARATLSDFVVIYLVFKIPDTFAFNLTYSLSLGQVRHCKLRVWQGGNPGQDVRLWDQHLVPDELKAKLTTGRPTVWQRLSLGMKQLVLQVDIKHADSETVELERCRRNSRMTLNDHVVKGAAVPAMPLVADRVTPLAAAIYTDPACASVSEWWVTAAGQSSDSGECLDPEAWPRQQVSVQYGGSRAVFDLRSAPSGLVAVCSRLTMHVAGLGSARGLHCGYVTLPRELRVVLDPPGRQLYHPVDQPLLLDVTCTHFVGDPPGGASQFVFVWTCDGLPCDKKHSQQDGQLVVRGLTVNNTMSVLVQVRLKHNLALVGNSSKVIQGQAEGGLSAAIRCYVNCDGGSVHEVTVLAAECTNCPQDTSLTYRWTYTAPNSPSFKEPLTSFADEEEVTQKRLKLKAGWMENVPAWVGNLLIFRVILTAESNGSERVGIAECPVNVTKLETVTGMSCSVHGQPFPSRGPSPVTMVTLTTPYPVLECHGGPTRAFNARGRFYRLLVKDPDQQDEDVLISYGFENKQNDVVLPPGGEETDFILQNVEVQITSVTSIVATVKVANTLKQARNRDARDYMKLRSEPSMVEQLTSVLDKVTSVGNEITREAEDYCLQAVEKLTSGLKLLPLSERSSRLEALFNDVGSHLVELAPGVPSTEQRAGSVWGAVWEEVGSRDHLSLDVQSGVGFGGHVTVPVTALEARTGSSVEMIVGVREGHVYRWGKHSSDINMPLVTLTVRDRTTVKDEYWASIRPEVTQRSWTQPITVRANFTRCQSHDMVLRMRVRDPLWNVTFVSVHLKHRSGSTIEVPLNSPWPNNATTYDHVMQDPEILFLPLPKAGEVIEGEWYDVNITVTPSPAVTGKRTRKKDVINLALYDVSCRQWSPERSTWEREACEVSSETSVNKLHCKCRHLTAVSGTILPHQPLALLDPEAVDIRQYVKDLGEQLLAMNPILTGVVAITWILYGLALFSLFYLDQSDKRKCAVAILEENNSEDNVLYLVGIVTAWSVNAGTTASVYMYIKGEKGKTDVHQLTDSKNRPFKTGAINWFLITQPQSIGHVTSVVIWHDCMGWSPAWYLKEVFVHDIHKSLTWHCIYNDWISASKGLCKEVKAVTPENAYRWRSYQFSFQLTLGLRTTHLWISIFKKPPYEYVTAL
ncbi:hypothetical protein BaRGS_00033334, partial [Batillaria attramentaria]